MRPRWRPWGARARTHWQPTPRYGRQATQRACGRVACLRARLRVSMYVYSAVRVRVPGRGRSLHTWHSGSGTSLRGRRRIHPQAGAPEAPAALPPPPLRLPARPAAPAQELDVAGAALHAIITQPTHCLPFLRAGRLVRVSAGGVDWGSGVVISVMKRPDAQPGQVRPRGRRLAARGCGLAGLQDRHRSRPRTRILHAYCPCLPCSCTACSWVGVARAEGAPAASPAQRRRSPAINMSCIVPPPQRTQPTNHPRTGPRMAHPPCPAHPAPTQPNPPACLLSPPCPSPPPPARPTRRTHTKQDERESYLVDCLLSVDGASCSGPAAAPKPAPPGAPGARAEVVPVTLACLAQLHSLRINVPPDLRASEARAAVMAQVRLPLGGWGRRAPGVVLGFRGAAVVAQARCRRAGGRAGGLQGGPVAVAPGGCRGFGGRVIGSPRSVVRGRSFRHAGS